MIDNIKQFFKINKIRNIIEISLIFLAIFCILDMFNVLTMLI